MLPLLVWWLVGVSACAFPLVIRNLRVFASVNPYWMHPSELSLWENLDRTGTVMLADLTTLPMRHVNLLADQYLALLVFVAGGALLLRYRDRIRRMNLAHFAREQRFPIFLAGYFLAYLAIVIAARTRYRWGELIDSRHLVQVYWIVWIAAGVLGLALLQRISGSRVVATRIAAGFFVLVLGAQAWAQARRIAGPRVPQVDAVGRLIGDGVIRYLADEVPAHQIVLARRADLLRIHADINARKLPTPDQYYKLQRLTLEELMRLGESGLLWGIVLGDPTTIRPGEYEGVAAEIVANPEDFPMLERVDAGGPAVVLRYLRAPLGPDSAIR